MATAVALAYLPVWRAGFVWDDSTHLLENPVLQPGGLARTWAPGDTHLNYWPLTFTAYWLEYHAWGLNALGFHLVNVGLHILAAVLVWQVLLRLGLSGVAAMLGAAVFALHPVAVEAVAWITQLKTLLPTVLALLSLLFYLRYEQRGGWWQYALALATFVLAALARGMAVTLPLVLLMTAWWQRRNITRRDVLHILPYALIGVAMAGLEVAMQRLMAGEDTVRSDSPAVRALTAGWAVWFYLGKLIWPMNLSFVYPRWNVNPGSPLHYLPGLLLLALLATAWGARRSWGRPVLMALVCYLALLLPVLGFVNIYFMRFSFVADHYQYLAMIVPIAAASALFTRSTKGLTRQGQTWLLGLVTVSVVVPLTTLTFARVGVYRNAEALWNDVVCKNPRCWLAHNNLGTILSARGRTNDAVAQYQMALQIKPDYAQAHYNLGLALAGCGRFDEAIACYRKAVEIQPNYVEAHYNLALDLAGHERFDEAIAHFQKAVDIRPDYAEAHNNLAAALGRMGQIAEAMVHLRKALEINPDLAETHDNLGVLLTKCGQIEEAIPHYRRALEIDPNFAKAHNHLGMALITRGQVAEAIVQFRKALEIQPDYAGARRNLEAAHAQQR
jgi:Tfp pilus assembly protein PilF